MKKDIDLNEKEFVTFNRHITKRAPCRKKNNYFSKKEFDICPVMLTTVRKGHMCSSVVVVTGSEKGQLL